MFMGVGTAGLRGANSQFTQAVVPRVEPEPEPEPTVKYEVNAAPLALPPALFVGTPPVVKLDLYADGSAFVLKNVLTAAECAHLVAQAEAQGFEDSGYSESVRINDRIAMESQAFAAALFARTRPFLVENESFEQPLEMKKRRYGAPSDLPTGTWAMVGLNEVFRVCKYEAGGFFSTHFDYGFTRNKHERSIQTFMVYLNAKSKDAGKTDDDASPHALGTFTGGPTTFFNDKQEHYVVGDRANAVCDYEPEAGSILVFNHHITHEGGALLSGTKYIMRSEVMYRRVTT